MGEDQIQVSLLSLHRAAVTVISYNSTTSVKISFTPRTKWKVTNCVVVTKTHSSFIENPRPPLSGVTHYFLFFWMLYRMFIFRKQNTSDEFELIIVSCNESLESPLDLYVCAVGANQMQCCGWSSRDDWNGNMVIVNSSKLLFPCSCQNVSATSGNFSDSGFCEAQTPDWPVYDVVSCSVSPLRSLNKRSVEQSALNCWFMLWVTWVSSNLAAGIGILLKTRQCAST